MPVAMLFPEVDTADEREALLARFGPRPELAFTEMLRHDDSPLPAESRADPTLLTELTAKLAGRREGHFSVFLLPLVAPWAARIRHEVRQSGLTDAITAQASTAMLGALLDVSLRTLVRSMRQAATDCRLRGSTPQDRYQDYQRLLAGVAEQRRICDAHPFLLPNLRHTAERAGENILTILRHLHADAAALRHEGLLPAEVTAIDLDAGDTHAGGRSVAILSCADGSRLVYKPRSLRIDDAFHRLIARVNHLAGTQLQGVPSLDCGDHGWARFLSTDLPESPAQEDHYFRQTGQLLAVTHLLGAADLHQENVVCHQGSPVIIDLETLMHPRLRTATTDPTRWTVTDDLMQGVNAVGLLPYVLVNGDDGIDVGATGYAQGALSPFKSIVVRNAGRDDMTVGLENTPMPAGALTPTVPDDSDRAVEVCALIQEGFTQVYRALAPTKELLATELPDLFRGTSVRLLLNPTVVYCQLLRLVTQPWFFQPGRQRIHGLQRIALWGRQDHPQLSRSEFLDLARGDVPMFTAAVDSTVLRDSHGQAVGDVLAESPLAGAVRRVRAMSESELAVQRRRISDMFIPKFPLARQRTSADPAARRPLHQHRGDTLRLAQQVGDQLVAAQRLGDQLGDPANWVGPRLDHDVLGWYPNVLETNLYAGLLGPATFLAQLAAVTGSARYRKAAEQVLDPLAARLAAGRLTHPDELTPRIGVYSGAAGIHLALAWSGRALSRQDWITAAIDHLPELEHLLTVSPGHDHLDGDAGILAMTRSLAALAGRATPNPGITNLAETAHRRLLLAAEREELSDVFSYSGFAHGAAGVRTALSLADPSLGLDSRTLQAQLLQATRSRYDATTGTYHASAASAGSSLGWCHGLLGIALGHVLQLEAGVTPAPEAERDLTRAAQVILQRGVGSNLSYCHGDTGNVEILTRIGSALNDDALRQAADGLTAHLVADVLPAAARDDCNRNAHSPSLFIGTSGIGWFALRVLEPDLVPSPLSLS